jgi:hypothetical protein
MSKAEEADRIWDANTIEWGRNGAYPYQPGERERVSALIADTPLKIAFDVRSQLSGLDTAVLAKGENAHDTLVVVKQALEDQGLRVSWRHSSVLLVEKAEWGAHPLDVCVRTCDALATRFDTPEKVQGAAEGVVRGDGLPSQHGGSVRGRREKPALSDGGRD